MHYVYDWLRYRERAVSTLFSKAGKVACYAKKEGENVCVIFGNEAPYKRMRALLQQMPTA